MKSVLRFIAFKLLIKLLIVAMLFPLNSFSAVAPPVSNTVLRFDAKGNISASYTGNSSAPTASYNKMQDTLSGVIYKKAGQSGLQGDSNGVWASRATSTIDGVASVAGTAASAVVGGLLVAATSPGWVGIATIAVVSSVIGYAVNLGINSLTKWLFRSDQQVDVSQDASTSTQPNCTLSAGGSYWSGGYYKASGAYVSLVSCDGVALAKYAYQGYLTEHPTYTWLPSDGDCRQDPSWLPTQHIKCFATSAIEASYYASGALATCPAGSQLYVGGTCVPFTSAPATTATKTLAQAIPAIPAADKAKPLNPAIIAALVNQLWREAASKPDYQGIPYSYANPVTEQDVSQWQQDNPSYYPTVDDFVKPNPPATSTGSPWSLPISGQPIGTPNGTQPAPTGTTNPAVPVGTTNPAPIINLGADPGIGAPSLEAPPTPPEILAPILNLMPTLKNFTPTTSTGTCPTPSFQLFGTTHTLTAHCTLIQNNKSIMQAAMGFAWAVMAMFILLSA
jgi:hypothetical protein